MISLRNKIGQMLVMGFNASELNDNTPVAKWLSEDGLGGVVLFDIDFATKAHGKNIKSQTQVQHLIHQLNHYAAKVQLNDTKLPLLVAIDYEGGTVDRLEMVEGCMKTETALQLARLSDSELEEELNQMALTLKSLGFNLNFAPVVDLHLNEQKGIIGPRKRSFSNNPDVVVRVACKFVEVFSSYGIACSYKHFPGHGSADADSHLGFVDVTDSYQKEELKPYEVLLQDKDKPVMVMTAHVVNRHLDDQGLPATLSPKIITGLLRETIGFDGVIISDDLQMQAISDHYPMEEALLRTINAGADMVIIPNQLDDHSAPEIINMIEQMVVNHKIDRDRIDEAFRRIVRLKQQMNCLEAADA